MPPLMRRLPRADVAALLTRGVAVADTPRRRQYLLIDFSFRLRDAFAAQSLRDSVRRLIYSSLTAAISMLMRLLLILLIIFFVISFDCCFSHISIFLRGLFSRFRAADAIFAAMIDYATRHYAMLMFAADFRFLRCRLLRHYAFQFIIFIYFLSLCQQYTLIAIIFTLR